MGIGRIVVGLDASEAARRALGWAVGVARELGAEIIAIHAVDLPTPLPRSRFRGIRAQEAEDVREALREEIYEGFASWCAPLWDSKVRYRALL
jgi:nucleotide-binding universal stress UspA family protein